MAVKKFRLKAGKFFYHEGGVLKKGQIGQIFEREENYVSFDMFEPVGEDQTLKVAEVVAEEKQVESVTKEIDEENDEEEVDMEIKSVFSRKRKRN